MGVKDVSGSNDRERGYSKRGRYPLIIKIKDVSGSNDRERGIRREEGTH